MSPNEILTKVWELHPVPAEDLQGIACSFAFFLALWFVVLYMPIPFKPKHINLNKMDDLDVRNRIVSIIHGLVCIVFAGYYTLASPLVCGDANTLFEKRLSYFSVGYFCYDLISMGYYGLVDKAMLIHHTVSIWGMSLPFTLGISMNFYIRCQFIYELSNPFMQARCILRHYGMRYTKAYESSEITFMLLYMYGRIISGTTVLLQNLACQHNPMIMKI